MKNIKQLEEEDLVFIDQPWTEQEKREFSEFLKSRKVKRGNIKNTKLHYPHGKNVRSLPVS